MPTLRYSGAVKVRLLASKKVCLGFFIRLFDFFDNGFGQNEIFERSGVIVKTVHVLFHAHRHKKITGKSQDQLFTHGANALFCDIHGFVHTVIAQHFVKLDAREFSIPSFEGGAFENIIAHGFVRNAKSQAVGRVMTQLHW